MAIDPIDPNQLWLDKDEARKNVVSGFRQLADNIENLRNDFGKYPADMGMGNCAEGTSWNSNMEHAREAVLKQLADYVTRAKDFANKAEAAINALDGQDRGSGAEFQQLSGEHVYPPLQKQGNGWV